MKKASASQLSKVQEAMVQAKIKVHVSLAILMIHSIDLATQEGPEYKKDNETGQKGTDNGAGQG